MSARPAITSQSTDGSPLVLEMAEIAAGPGDAAQRAEAVLERLWPLVRFDAAFVALLHPDRRVHLPLVRSGYDARTCAFLDSPTWMHDVETLGMQRKSEPIRACDLTVDPAELQSWSEYLVPAGFREGIGVGLFSADGRFLGILGLHTESAVSPSDEVRDAIATVAPLIAHAVDPIRSLSTVATAVADAVAGVVVTAGGTALPLPGLPPHQLFMTGSAVLQAATDQLARGCVHARFLSPAGEVADGERYLRITVMPAAAGAPYHYAAVVTVSPPGDLYGLTRRELEVLGLLVEGWPNHAMAVGLGITERTVAAHIEHILAKLAVRSRTVAAIWALRLGLYVPRLLHAATGRVHAEP